MPLDTALEAGDAFERSPEWTSTSWTAVIHRISSVGPSSSSSTEAAEAAMVTSDVARPVAVAVPVSVAFPLVFVLCYPLDFGHEEGWVCKLAGDAVWAEADQVERAHDPADVLERAVGACSAEASGVAPALRSSLVRGDVEVHALVPAATEAVFCKEPALWHLSEVVLVEELALASLLAQPAEPMLADCL